MPQLTGYEFMDGFDNIEAFPYTKADWLLNDFGDTIWKIQIAHKSPVELDWRVQLPNGDLLTYPAHSELLASLRHFLIIGTDGIDGQFTTLANFSRKMRFVSTCRVIDYILIRAEPFKLLEFGLAGLDLDNFKSILTALASHPNAEESVYKWRETATIFCRTLIENFDESKAKKIYEKWPTILHVSDQQLEELELDIPPKDIPKLRAALKYSGFYYGNATAGYKASSTKMSSQMYQHSLRGKQTPKSKLNFLNFFPGDATYDREFPRAKVTTGEDNRLLETTYVVYRSVLASIHAISTTGLPAPDPEDTLEISEYKVDVNTSARFRSVPADVLFDLFRKGLEFYFDYGHAILDGFSTVARHCALHDLKMSTLSEQKLSKLLNPTLKQMGVKRIGLSCYGEMTGARKKRSSDREKYFYEFRRNEGLLELVLVCFGVIKFTVGTLMARRVDELIPLKTEGCLDATKSWLIFGLEKSSRGVLGARQIEERPIDEIGSEMIENLCNFQVKLRDAGFINNLTTVFAVPSLLGKMELMEPNHHLYNRSLDFLCDYFESGLNDAGERYYVRQHQLRRFFAIMFFYTNSFGELDTLRWMLGHRDVEHVWHYLTECLSPGEIAGAGAKYFTDLAKSDRLENYKDLQHLLQTKFGTTKVHLVDENQIERYLDSMLKEGYARIQPEFFKTETGKSMRVLFVLSKSL